MTKTIGQKHKRKHRHGYTTEEHDKSGSENFALRWKQLRQIQLKRGKIAQSDCFVVIFYATQNYPLSKVECPLLNERSEPQMVHGLPVQSRVAAAIRAVPAICVMILAHMVMNKGGGGCKTERGKMDEGSRHWAKAKAGR